MQIPAEVWTLQKDSERIFHASFHAHTVHLSEAPAMTEYKKAFITQQLNQNGFRPHQGKQK